MHVSVVNKVITQEVSSRDLLEGMTILIKLLATKIFFLQSTLRHPHELTGNTVLLEASFWMNFSCQRILINVAYQMCMLKYQLAYMEKGVWRQYEFNKHRQLENCSWYCEPEM